MLTVLGQVVAPEGLAVHLDALGDAASATIAPALAYKRHQAVDLPVYLDHDTSWRLGSGKYLLRSERLGLMAVAVLDADVEDLLADGPWFWSDSITSHRLGDTLYRTSVELRELSLVRATANCRTSPVVWANVDIATSGGGAQPPMRLAWRSVWERAAQALEGQRYRRAAQHLSIVDLDPLDPVSEILTDPDAARQRAAARPTRPSPTPAHGRVRLDGRWLDEKQSARVLDLMGYETASDGTLVRA